jgi:SAM-dependent methyltransferase
MHHTALQNSKLFFDTYSKAFELNNSQPIVIEIGSQDVNGSIRQFSPPNFNYIGVDFVNGKGVDVLLSDPYKLPFENNSADIIVTSSCLEHSELFWVLYLEMMRVLKEDGILYINAPSNGEFHRWPVDCWRFYPDSGNALVKWSKHNGINSALLESFTTAQIHDQWNDFIAVILKDERHLDKFPDRIVRSLNYFNNGYDPSISGDLINYSIEPEDKKKLRVVKEIVENKIKVN